MTTSRLTLAALAAFSSICTLAGASAQAQTDAPRSRAEVIAEVHAARAAGTLGAYAGEDSGSIHLSQQAGASRPRAEVVAELSNYRESGAMAAQVAEDQFFALPTGPSTLSRAEVLAELAVASTSGSAGAWHGEDSGSFHLGQHGASGAASHFAAAQPNRAPQAAAEPLSQVCASPAVGSQGGELRVASHTR